MASKTPVKAIKAKKPATANTNKETPRERAERLRKEADEVRISATKAALLQSLEAHRGNVSNACKSLTPGISRDTFYEYKKNDPVFAAKVNEIKEIVIDFVEDKMFEIINDKGKGAPGLIIWYLKTQARHRGYIEHDIEDANDAGKVKITVSYSKKKVDLDDDGEYERPDFDKNFIEAAGMKSNTEIDTAEDAE